VVGGKGPLEHQQPKIASAFVEEAEGIPNKRPENIVMGVGVGREGLASVHASKVETGHYWLPQKGGGVGLLVVAAMINHVYDRFVA
jgi:hypothetical protein